MTEAFRAARILTMNSQCPEIRDGGILVREGRILAVGSWREVAGDGACRDLGPVTIVPGLINAHVHLELSHLAGRVPGGRGFEAWADGLFAAMRESRVTEAAMERAVAEARASGTCYMADVVGREFDMVRRVVDSQGLGGFLFNEFSGRDREFCPRPLPGDWSPGVHALYSTDHSLARSIKEWCSSRGLPFSLHLAEVPGENELFQSGGGEFADFLRTRRILPKGCAAPGLSAAGFARELGLLDERTLAVHCVHVDENDVEILAASGACVCLCPRSNSWIGVGDAPVAALCAAGVPLCLGTDSLASVPSLDLWQELRAARALMPCKASLFDLLALVTRNPARVLGIEADYGSLAVGTRAVWTVLPDDMQ
ncbi:amidohydrolase family protein [Desulfomicrobium sp. ZS1]|uniref:amidohydrolase family protein n=1 Tax=Desulfomicrobium sp. ZS1 TaxID=2952228 RepID=UPI0020B1DC60|nr:amidohydrolase family protein [Desulfomicrobium sp. ZS1]UTF49217.1 amidohydrolase family protein [Desulfomicrobium sp. ZS1]